MTNGDGKGVDGPSTGLLSLCAAIAMLIGLSVAGCQPARQARPVENVSSDTFADVLTFTGALISYADATGRMPDSKETLRDFCLKSCLPCATLDWSKFSWRQMDDRSITAIYTSQDYTLPITMTTDPPSVHVGGQPTEEMEERLRGLMKE